MTAQTTGKFNSAHLRHGRKRSAPVSVARAEWEDAAPTKERQAKGMRASGKTAEGGVIWRDDTCTPLHRALKARAILPGHFDAGERWLKHRRACLRLRASGGAIRDSLDMTPRGSGESAGEWATRVKEEDKAARKAIPMDLLGAVEAFVVWEERVTDRFDLREMWWRDVRNGLDQLAMFFGIDVSEEAR